MTDTTLSNFASPNPRDLLPPRRETFLARYPRKWKLAATALFFCAGLGLWIGLLPKDSHAPSEEDQDATHLEESASTEPHHEKIPQITPESLFPTLPDKPIARPTSAAEEEAIAHNDAGEAALHLSPAPDPEMVEGDGKDGYLPIISKDGRQPWQVYARPFDFVDKRPRIALVITGLGASRVATDAAIQRLPPQVTLAFDATSPLVSSWLTRARDDGHETLLALPMEPFDYPRSDPGPNTLLTSLSTDNNISRLQTLLRRGVGYIGVLALGHSRFAEDPAKMEPVLKELKKRGLFVFDAQNQSKSHLRDPAKKLHLPFAANTQQIDVLLTPEGIDAALGYLEQSARLTGHAVGIASSLPLTLDRIDRWRAALASRGIALAPLSAMVQE